MMLKHGGVFSKMKIKRMVKRLFAVGTGVVMLGATAMGAMAADLGNYPGMFVKDGVFDGYFVVGENAASVDNLAMTDIAASMKVASGGTTSTSVEGDAWLVGTSAKFLEMANNDASAGTLTGEVFRNITNNIGDDELGALTDGAWETNEDTYDSNQYLHFDDDRPDSRVVKFVESDDDATADFLYFKSGRQIARYEMEFTSTAQSDVTDSSGTSDTTGTYLDDFENTELSFMGQSYTVVLARRVASGPEGGGNSIKLTLMGGATTDTLLEGESQTYTVNDNEYDIALTYVDATNAKFTVNGESTSKLQVGETHMLADKSEVGVSEVLYQSYAGGVHSATFFVGASKVVLRDDDLTTGTGSSYDLKVGSEDIDGAAVVIDGSDDNTTLKINTIEINMTADDDYFVGAGEKLSDVILADDDEPEILMNDGFDIEYLGLEDQETHDLVLRSSSSKRYKLEVFDGDSNAVSIPIAYAEANNNISMSEDTGLTSTRTNVNRLVINEFEYIYKDDYFIVTAGTASDGSAKSYLLQYKGQDKTTKSSPKMKFKNTGSGETLEYSVASTNASATIKLGGFSFDVNGQSSAADDQPIKISLNGDATVGNANVTWVDAYGPEITISDRTFKGANAVSIQPAMSNASDTVFLSINSAVNGDDYDNLAPTTITLNISASSDPEVRAALSGLSLLAPDGESEVTYGYTSMGGKVQFDQPSSDPDKFTYTYPVEQALPQVYFTSGATATSSSASGNMVAVEVVDATKLDSEVADAMAQNLIVVGGPCVNTVAAELLGNPVDCTEGFTPGKARVKLFENGESVAMLVAGYSGADTRLAGKVIAQRYSELSGDEVEIEGTTTADATIGAPTVVEEVMEEVVEPEVEAEQ